MVQLDASRKDFAAAVLATLSLSLGANAQAGEAVRQGQRPSEILTSLRCSDDIQVWKKGLSELTGLADDVPSETLRNLLSRDIYERVPPESARDYLRTLEKLAPSVALRDPNQRYTLTPTLYWGIA